MTKSRSELQKDIDKLTKRYRQLNKVVRRLVENSTGGSIGGSMSMGQPMGQMPMGQMPMGQNGIFGGAGDVGGDVHTNEKEYPNHQDQTGGGSTLSTVNTIMF